MEIKVLRHSFSDTFTLGVMLLDGQFFGHTLEDMVRDPGVKVKDHTAIAAGEYKVTIERSTRFSIKAGRDVFLPRLHGVPQFEGVLIHGGNTHKDTEGCILIAERNLTAEDRGLIQGSLSARLTERLQKAGKEHTIKIIDCRG